MKLIILVSLFIWSSPIFSQYSNYYSNIYTGKNKKSQNKVDVNATINHNINANINVSGNITEQKTITTIDYGALELANAQREKNRLEQQRFDDYRLQRILNEIAENPLKAIDYGYNVSDCLKDNKRYTKAQSKTLSKIKGLKNYCLNYICPHSSLFTQIGGNSYQNVSGDGVITEILFYGTNLEKDISYENLEKSYDYLIVGEERKLEDNSKYFVHMKDINRATVCRFPGFRFSSATEDNYEITLSDIYKSIIGSNLVVHITVSFYGDKDKVTFEQLEGRRYYFRNLIQKIVATGYVDKIKI